jgi:hypothetical protein
MYMPLRHGPTKPPGSCVPPHQVTQHNIIREERESGGRAGPGQTVGCCATTVPGANRAFLGRVSGEREEGGEKDTCEGGEKGKKLR